MKVTLKNRYVLTALVALVMFPTGFWFYGKYKYDLKPPTVSNLFTLGQIKATQGQHAEAITHFEKLLESDTKHIFAMRFMVDSYIALNNANKAFETLNKIIEIDPSPDNLSFAVASALHMKDQDRALKYSKLAQSLAVKKLPL